LIVANFLVNLVFWGSLGGWSAVFSGIVRCFTLGSLPVNNILLQYPLDSAFWWQEQAIVGRAQAFLNGSIVFTAAKVWPRQNISRIVFAVSKWKGIR
jgi:hypothetical protein